MIAAELGYTEVAEVLINHKADLFATEKVISSIISIVINGIEIKFCLFSKYF